MAADNFRQGSTMTPNSWNRDMPMWQAEPQQPFRPPEPSWAHNLRQPAEGLQEHTMHRTAQVHHQLLSSQAHMYNQPHHAHQPPPTRPMCPPRQTHQMPQTHRVHPVSPPDYQRLGPSGQQPSPKPKAKPSSAAFSGKPEEGSMLSLQDITLMSKSASEDPPAINMASGEVKTTRASCRFSLFETRSNERRPMHCESQLCEIKTYRPPYEPHRIAYIHLPRPFVVPQHTLRVRQADGILTYASSYGLRIELEASDDDSWPPLDHEDFGLSPLYLAAVHPLKRCIVSTMEFTGIAGSLSNMVIVTSGHPPVPGVKLTHTNYLLCADLKWTTESARDSTQPAKVVIPQPTTFVEMPNGEFEEQKPAPISIPVTEDKIEKTTGHSSIEAADDQLAEPDTPSRLLRHRDVQTNYNLKALSDIARGRKRPNLDLQSDSRPLEGGQVLYNLSVNQSLRLDLYRCVACGASQGSVQLLQAHFEQHHSSYNFELSEGDNGVTFTVTPRQPTPSNSDIVPFELPAWPSRQTSHPASEDAEPLSPAARRHWKARLQSPRKHASTKLPTPPNGDVDEAVISRLSKQKIIERPPVLVPQIKQTLYHPISKAKLKAGELLPSTEPDQAWLLQKHRDNIAEFTDVSDCEKDFIWKWDDFILRRDISAMVYLAPLWLEFVKTNARWLVASPERMIEFGNHMAVLLARNALDDEIMESALVHIKDARKEAPPTGHREYAPFVNAGPIVKSASGCSVCKLPVRGPRTLVCANKMCAHRQFHSDCIRDAAKMDVSQRRWKCNDCCGEEMDLS